MSKLACREDTHSRGVIFQPGMIWLAKEGRFKISANPSDEQNDPTNTKDQSIDAQKQELNGVVKDNVDKKGFGLEDKEYFKTQDEDFDQDSLHLMTKKVILAYGPYDVHGVFDLRTDRLHGLISALEKEGADVQLKPSYHINHIRLWHLGQVIFSSKIHHLPHGKDAGQVDDKLSKKAARLFKWNSQRAQGLLQHQQQDQSKTTPPGDNDEGQDSRQDVRTIKRIPLPKKDE